MKIDPIKKNYRKGSLIQNADWDEKYIIIDDYYDEEFNSYCFKIFSSQNQFDDYLVNSCLEDDVLKY